MLKTSPLIWVFLILILLLPTAAGRIVLDLAGGLIIAMLAIPLFLTGAGWIGWRYLQSRMVTCQSCGATTFSNSIQCPICGSKLTKKDDQNGSGSPISNSIPASSATIDIKAENAD